MTTREERGDIESNHYKLQDADLDHLTDKDGRQLIIFGPAYQAETERTEER